MAKSTSALDDEIRAAAPEAAARRQGQGMHRLLLSPERNPVTNEEAFVATLLPPSNSDASRSDGTKRRVAEQNIPRRAVSGGRTSGEDDSRRPLHEYRNKELGLNESDGYEGANQLILMDQLETLGSVPLQRALENLIGPERASELVARVSQDYVNKKNKNPVNYTVKGEEKLAELEANKGRYRIPIGGTGTHHHPTKVRNYALDNEMAINQEMKLTFTRDQEGKPLYKRGMELVPCEGYSDDTGARNINVLNGNERMVSDIYQKIYSAASSNSLESLMSALKTAFDPKNQLDEALDKGRDVDTQLDEDPSSYDSVMCPVLKLDGDRDGNLNDKSLRECRNRLGDKVFSGPDGDLTCRQYMEEMRSFLNGRFNSSAAYALFKASCKGDPLQTAQSYQNMGIAFVHFWTTFHLFFGKTEDPHAAMQKLVNLRVERPVNLPARFVKISKLSEMASFMVSPMERWNKAIDLMIGETKMMLRWWFPDHARSLMEKYDRKQKRWASERDSYRERDLDPDLYARKVDFHPWTTLCKTCIEHLRGVFPEERPRGVNTGQLQSVMRRPQPLRKKVRRDVYALQDETPFNPGVVPDIAYAESIAESVYDEDWEEDALEGDYGESGRDYVYESDDQLDDEYEVDAIHPKPGEIMRRFAQPPRPPQGNRDRMPKDGRDPRRRDDRRPPPRPRAGDREARLKEKFPNIGKEDQARLCANCGSRFHSWTYCGTYGGQKPDIDRKPCCHNFHKGPCKRDEVRELEEKKKNRATEKMNNPKN